MQRIALFLATKKGYTALEKLISSGFIEKVKLVFTFKEVNVDKSYDKDIVNLCLSNNVAVHYWGESKDNLQQYFQDFSITSAFAIGWRYLIPLDINNVLETDLIVFHDSLLPRYRGFSPTPTAIICGENILGVTALFASDKVDAGDIVLQSKIDVANDEYISEIISRQSELYSSMLINIISQIESNSLRRTKQNDNLATYSIWRDISDCQIDWTATSTDIYNLIRAVSNPYPGAYTYYRGKKMIINRARTVDDLEFQKRDVGKIWSITNGVPQIVCGSGMLEILDASYDDGEKVVFTSLRTRMNTTL